MLPPGGWVVRFTLALLGGVLINGQLSGSSHHISMRRFGILILWLDRGIYARLENILRLED